MLNILVSTDIVNIVYFTICKAGSYILFCIFLMTNDEQYFNLDSIFNFSLNKVVNLKDKEKNG